MSTGATKPYHHGSLHAALLSEGLALLAEAGEDDMSLREIARRAGVSATAVYRHFPDKRALMIALSAVGLQRLVDSQRAAAKREGGGGAGFYATGQAYVEFALANPALFRLLFSHPPEGGAAHGGRPAEAMVMLLDYAAELAPQGSDPQVFALRSWASVHGLAVLMLDGQVPPDRALIRAIIAPH